MNVFITGITGSLGVAISTSFASVGHRTYGTPVGISDKAKMEKACMDGCVDLDANFSSWPAHMDVLVLNDGHNHLSRIGETPEDDAKIIDVNVMGTYWALNWFMGKTQFPGKVIFIASQTHRVAQRTTALYCASKAAVVQMARVAARELGPIGVQVNVLCPGKIEDTTMAAMTDAQVMDLRGWSPSKADEYAKGLIPMGRFTNTREVAEAVMWLARAPAYVHGSVIDMTGGV